MVLTRKSPVVLALLIAATLAGCSNDTAMHEHLKSNDRMMTRSEHDRDGKEHARERRGDRDNLAEGAEHGEEGEESGTELALNERYDKVRKGAHLIISYDAQRNSFVGTVENTTDKTLERVRVEVHLSNGRELGPTTPVDLGPGEKRAVELEATSRDFSRWTAHPEAGSSEHGHGEEGGGHDR